MKAARRAAGQPAEKLPAQNFWPRPAARVETDHEINDDRIMTGELAPARHVLSAATRCWEAKI
jgi:hypothetical protein